MSGQRRGHAQHAAVRARQDERAGVEMELPWLRHALGARGGAAILAVAEDRRAERDAVGAELMGASGHRHEDEPAYLVARMGDDGVAGDRRTAVLLVGHDALAETAPELRQRQIDPSF